MYFNADFLDELLLDNGQVEIRCETKQECLDLLSDLEECCYLWASRDRPTALLYNVGDGGISYIVDRHKEITWRSNGSFWGKAPLLFYKDLCAAEDLSLSPMSFSDINELFA